MPKTRGESTDCAHEPPSIAQEQKTSEEAVKQNGEQTPKNRPCQEFRLGRIKAVVFANETEAGTKHNVILRRIYKRDQSAQWEQTDSLGRDDLPLGMEVLRQAWLWIYAGGQAQAKT